MIKASALSYRGCLAGDETAFIVDGVYSAVINGTSNPPFQVTVSTEGSLNAILRRAAEAIVADSILQGFPVRVDEILFLGLHKIRLEDD